ncbi:hypothetical protein QRD43_08405 [Pelomonas sp. APW6]|uniref:SPOR domain-containing protein n=1 Tax=Roseateles subflavus TaxID=3053353 RepID=A0ABT7LHM1_9BURK|nr:hypothetical protein [Pelomonas sp. APW6]MDL5031929.1 hypothetical protein [Pelomonas sp. APW6]
MQALETLLSSQLAAWHNRHPLARRVRAVDVHTMGVIALPFMRSGPPREPQEPVLGEAGSFSAEPSFTQPPRPGLLQRLLAWRPGRQRPRDRWPVFSEQFVVGVSPRQAGEFARRYGYSQRPDGGSWPLRSIPVDETLAAQDPADGAGAWPEEIYLLSAALDAGPARTRVLVAQGAGLRLYITGPRCLHPLKVGLFGLLMALLLGLVLLASLSPKKASPGAAAPAAAASAAQPASAATPAASGPMATEASGHEHAASAPLPPELPASAAHVTAPPAAASAPPVPSAAPGSAPTLMTASQLPDNMASAPDIRPRLVPRPEGGTSAKDTPAPSSKESGKDGTKPPARPTDEVIERAHSSGVGNGALVRPAQKTDRPPLRDGEASSSAKAASDDKAPRTPASEAKPAPASTADALRQRPGKGAEGRGGQDVAGTPLVALVGPALPSKAEAEAYLQKMQPLIQPLVGKRPLELQVIQTPEGWRAAAWPFPSREEAQLINAMLVARGLRTRAVDF